MQQPRFIKRILIGVDERESARDVLVAGLSLAKELGAAVHCMHAVPLPVPVWTEVGAPPTLASTKATVSRAREAVLPQVEAARVAAGYETSSSEALLEVECGLPAHVLLEVAQRQGSDLVILGPHGKASPLDLGNTARFLLTHGSTPVWVHKGTGTLPRRIVAAIDDSDHAELVLEGTRALAEALGAKVEVVHVYSPPVFAYADGFELGVPAQIIGEERSAARRFLDERVAALDWGRVEVSTSFLEGEPRGEILGKASGSELLVLGTHGRTALSRFLLGSVAQGVLARSEVPVCVLPGPKRSWLFKRREPDDSDASRS